MIKQWDPWKNPLSIDELLHELEALLQQEADPVYRFGLQANLQEGRRQLQKGEPGPNLKPYLIDLAWMVTFERHAEQPPAPRLAPEQRLARLDEIEEEVHLLVPLTLEAASAGEMSDVRRRAIVEQLQRFGLLGFRWAARRLVSQFPSRKQIPDAEWQERALRHIAQRRVSGQRSVQADAAGAPRPAPRALALEPIEALRGQSRALYAAGHICESARLLARARELVGELDAPEEAFHIQHALAATHLDAGRARAAHGAFEEALALLRRVPGRLLAPAQRRRLFVDVLLAQLEAAADIDELGADRLLAKHDQIARFMEQHGLFWDARARLARAKILHRRGRHEEALPLLRRALAARRESDGAGEYSIGTYLWTLGDCCRGAGDVDGAIKAYAEVFQAARPHIGDAVLALCGLAWCDLQLSAPHSALTSATEAHARAAGAGPFLACKALHVMIAVHRGLAASGDAGRLAQEQLGRAAALGARQRLLAHLDVVDTALELGDAQAAREHLQLAAALGQEGHALAERARRLDALAAG